MRARAGYPSLRTLRARSQPGRSAHGPPGTRTRRPARVRPRRPSPPPAARSRSRSERYTARSMGARRSDRNPSWPAGIPPVLPSPKRLRRASGVFQLREGMAITLPASREPLARRLLVAARQARDEILSKFHEAWDADETSATVPVLYWDIDQEVPGSGAWILGVFLTDTCENTPAGVNHPTPVRFGDVQTHVNPKRADHILIASPEA